VLFSFASNEMDSNEIKLNRLKERKWANWCLWNKQVSLIIFLYFSLQIDKQTTIYTIYFFTQGSGRIKKKFQIFQIFIKNFLNMLPIQKKFVCACHSIATSKNAFTTHIDSI
jgi:hypothetical protein